ncbi:hypothetical protein Tco_0484900 [Tanacetum coccineum]
MDREVQQLKQSRIPIVKVRWNSRQGPKFTWEREDFFKNKYPHLFLSKCKASKKNRAPGRRCSSKASMIKNKGLIAKAYEWDEEEVLSNDNEMVEVKVLMALAEDNETVSKEGARNDPSSSGQKDLVLVKSSADDTKVSIPGVERLWLFEAEGFILPNHDIGRILPAESQRNTTDSPVAITDSSATNYDSVDESSVCSTPLPPLKKLDGDEPSSGPKTIKSILRIISLRRGIKPRNPQHVIKSYKTCSSTVHTTTDHNDIEWFRRGLESVSIRRIQGLGYGVLGVSWSRNRYTVSSLMDTAYWSSE